MTTKRNSANNTTTYDFARLPTLPNGWCWATVNDLAALGEQPVMTGPFGSTLGTEDFISAGVPLLTIGCLTEHGVTLDKAFFISEEKARQLSRYRVRSGDLLFSRSASVGRAGLVTERFADSVINYHLMRLRLANSVIDPTLFISYVRGSAVVADYLREINHGATRDGINTAGLLEMPVAVPPMLEQRRIVAKLDELFSDLDAGVAALGRARANLKRYRAAVLKAAIEGRLTERWRAEHPTKDSASQLLERILAERRRKWEADHRAKYAAAGRTPPKDWQAKYVEPKPPDTTGLPELPCGWCWATVEQMGDVQLGRQRSPKNRSDKYPTKYIRAANITEDGLALDDILDMDFSPNEQATYRLAVGDIVLSEASGSPDQVGKPAVWNGEIENCCFQNTVIRLRPAGPFSSYALVVFRDYYFNKRFAKVAAGVGINHLSAAKFSVLPFPLAPLEEQALIVAEVEERLSVLDAAESQIETNLLRSARLRQSILKRAFDGKLVPQDPNDEPASVLLERIRAERASAKNGTPLKRHPARGRKEP